MKKTVLSVIVSLASASALLAQPTLTAATNNPVPGESFYGHYQDTTLTPGAPGGPQTWDFSSLAATSMDTTSYYTCATTPACDSFPGTDIVQFDNTDYYYMDTSGNVLSMLGAYTGGTNVHVGGHLGIMYYPLTYNATHVDTSSIVYDVFGMSFFHTQIDSMVYDAYGTLTTPSGTYSNVVRVHAFNLSKDSSAFTGVTTSLVEAYNWYRAGFHNPILTYSIDTANGNYAEYYTQGFTLGVDSKKVDAQAFKLYPNPAADVVNLEFSLSSTQSAAITLTDLSGRTIKTIGAGDLKAGFNQLTIATADLPAGMYLINLQSAQGNITRKVVVAK